MVDWTDYQASATARSSTTTRLEELRARSERAVAERLGRLLTLDEWATFKALVEERIASGEGLLAQAQERLGSDPPLDHQERERLTMVIYGLRRQLDAYRDVLALPAQLTGASERGPGDL